VRVIKLGGGRKPKLLIKVKKKNHLGEFNQKGIFYPSPRYGFGFEGV
jgi:hypothetical protein